MSRTACSEWVIWNPKESLWMQGVEFIGALFLALIPICRSTNCALFSGWWHWRPIRPTKIRTYRQQNDWILFGQHGGRYQYWIGTQSNRNRHWLTTAVQETPGVHESF